MAITVQGTTECWGGGCNNGGGWGGGWSNAGDYVYQTGVMNSLGQLRSDNEANAVNGARNTGDIRHEICQNGGHTIESMHSGFESVRDRISTLSSDCCQNTGRITDAVGVVGAAVATTGTATALGLKDIGRDICTATASINNSINQSTASLSMQAERIAAAATLQAAQNAAEAARCCYEVKCEVNKTACETQKLIDAQTATLIAAGVANTQLVLDKLCNAENAALRDKIAEQREELQTAKLMSHGHHGNHGYHGGCCYGCPPVCNGGNGNGNNGNNS